jgi:biotin transport system substrate-specific component
MNIVETASKPISLDGRISGALSVLLFAGLTALGAFVYVSLPFTPVPLTLQVFFVLLSGAVLGRKGAFSQALYVMAGAAGLPIFAGAGGGIARLLGPTGGYLQGFILSPLLVGHLCGRGERRPVRTLMAVLSGVAVIYVCGALQLGLLLHLTPVKALQLGVFPFLPGDLLKASLAAMTALGISKSRI